MIVLFETPNSTAITNVFSAFDNLRFRIYSNDRERRPAERFCCRILGGRCHFLITRVLHVSFLILTIL